MKRFVAYFDYLGFKDFIEKNDLEYQKRIMNNIFRDIESALGQGETRDGKNGGVVADLGKTTLNVINFSDTVIFWTNDDSEESFQELLKVAYRFNYQATTFFFPARGTIVLDEMEHAAYSYKNEAGGAYHINSVYGKGLVKAHLKSDAQQWSGAVIEEEVIDHLKSKGIDPDRMLGDYAKRYKVPYNPERIKVDHEEYALKLVTGITDESFKNVSKNIVRNFGEHNKSTALASTQLKIENTIAFLASHDKAK